MAIEDIKKEMRGGPRPGSGRKKSEGRTHMYTVADDVHDWIMQHGAGQYITDTFRVIIATQPKANNN